MWGELGVHYGVHSGTVAHVDKIGLAGTYFFGKQHSLTHILMRGMLLGVKGINDKSLSTFQQLESIAVHAFHISNVREFSYSETYNGHSTMPYTQRKNLQITHLNLLI